MFITYIYMNNTFDLSNVSFWDLKATFCSLRLQTIKGEICPFQGVSLQILIKLMSWKKTESQTQQVLESNDSK